MSCIAVCWQEILAEFQEGGSQKGSSSNQAQDDVLLSEFLNHIFDLSSGPSDEKNEVQKAEELKQQTAVQVRREANSCREEAVRVANDCDKFLKNLQAKKLTRATLNSSYKMWRTVEKPKVLASFARMKKAGYAPEDVLSSQLGKAQGKKKSSEVWNVSTHAPPPTW